MKKGSVPEILFILIGVLLFGSFAFKDIQINNSSTYFLSAPNHYKNSIRDFSVGQISTINQHSDTLPKINIKINEQSFFGFDGIYTLGSIWHNNNQINSEKWWEKKANYWQKDADWEVNVDVEFITTSNHFFSSDIKLKINGNNTRAYPQKSVRIKSKALKYEFFGEKSSNWIILRNSGNDWDRTMFADVFISDIISKSNLLTSKSVLTKAFINNSFWGLYNVRERIDEYYIASKLNCRLKDVFLFYGNNEVKFGDKKASKDLKKLHEIIDSSNVQLLLKTIDIDNFFEYVIFETYFVNKDWPNNNVLFYKIDGQEKFYFIPKDFDYAMSYTSKSAYQIDMFEHVLKKKKSIVSNVFRLLMNDNNIKAQFKNKANLMLKTQLSKKNLLDVFKYYSSNYELHIPEQISRWRYPKSQKEWARNVESNRQFIENRLEYYKTQLENL